MITTKVTIIADIRLATGAGMRCLVSLWTSSTDEVTKLDHIKDTKKDAVVDARAIMRNWGFNLSSSALTIWPGMVEDRRTVLDVILF